MPSNRLFLFKGSCFSKKQKEIIPKRGVDKCRAKTFPAKNFGITLGPAFKTATGTKKIHTVTKVMRAATVPIYFKETIQFGIVFFFFEIACNNNKEEMASNILDRLVKYFRQLIPVAPKASGPVKKYIAIAIIVDKTMTIFNRMLIIIDYGLSLNDVFLSLKT